MKGKWGQAIVASVIGLAITAGLIFYLVQYNDPEAVVVARNNSGNTLDIVKKDNNFQLIADREKAKKEKKKKEKKEYRVSKADEDMYVNVDVLKVRKGPGTSYKVVGKLVKDESIKVTGKTDNHWYRFTYQDDHAFVKGSNLSKQASEEKLNEEAGPSSPTYVKGVLIASKEHPLPKDYAPGESTEARNAFNEMAKDAEKAGYELVAFSTYRSYDYQVNLFNNYAERNGIEAANRYSAKPGESEHQTGLSFDVGEVGKEDQWFEYTDASKWMANHAHKYGFIVRYPKGKEDITGYIYEPWHLRYLGTDLAVKVKESGLTLEEYLGMK